ncbi:MAG: ribonuclease R [Porcipelethomonas sp.]
MAKNKKNKKSGQKNPDGMRKNPGDKFSVDGYKNRIVTFVQKSGRKPVPPKELAAKCRSVKGNESNYKLAIAELTEDGIICQRRRGYVMCDILGYFKAEVMRLNRTFGFIKRSDNDEEIFVPGKFLCGAMPGDIVLAGYIESRSEGPEGEVIDILKPSDAKLTGIIIEEEGQKLFLADEMSKTPVRIENGDIEYKVGDKVMAELCRMGKRHRDHRVKILFSFGDSQTAQNCAEAVLALNGVEKDFPDDVKREATRIAAAGVWPDDCKNRLDLRHLPIFTIDSAESKDLDDAVSLEKTADGYVLGVHIADVSHYVKGNSPLDKEALERGTSIYYADKVIPMLPKELSNGICSLNPDEDRLTFSAIMNITKDGHLRDFRFEKSVIRSRIKGIYSEINTILDGTASDEIKNKYSELIPSVMLMNELADIRIENRKKRGAPEIDTAESKIILNENKICVDVKPRTRGKSEMIIEEFMLLANESAAKLAAQKQIPFVYRTHEQPAPEKIESLKEGLRRLNVEIPVFNSVKPAHLAQILENSKDKPCYPVVNMMTLRSMAKAKYQTEPIGHFGLALDDYAHFTSPIRRYPDLAIHRILSDVIDGADSEWLEKRYSGFAQKASEHSTAAEIKAMNIERDCEDCYKAEYMQNHVGDEFDGIISSVTEFGFYVQLENTVEGLVHINTLPEGYYNYDGYFAINDEYSDRSYCAGDRVRVICARADVNSGKIDFELA